MKKTATQRMLARTLALALVFVLAAGAFPGALGQTAADSIPLADGEAPLTFRVLLTRLALTDRLDVTLNGAYSAVVGGSEMVFVRGSDLTVLLKNGRMVLYYLGMSLEGGQEMTLVRHPTDATLDNGLTFANNPSIYEGDLRLSVTEGKLRAILTIGVEDYIKGVVPYEMNDSYPLEALKAQAVAARTYAVSRALANGKQAYDLVDNTNDQSYRGRRETNRQTALAVDETRGVCGFYKGKLATCYYSASNGGQTELPGHVWEKQSNLGYLDMRDDPYDLENPQSKVMAVKIPKAAAEVTDTPYALRKLLSDQLKDTLTAAGYDAAPESLLLERVTAVKVDTPRFDSPSRLYTVLHITFAYAARTRTDPAPTAAPEATPAPALANDEEVSLFTPEPTPTPSPAPTDAQGALIASPVPTLAPTPTPTPMPSYGPFTPVAGEVTLDIPIFPDAERALSLGINSYDNELITVTEQADSFTIESRRFGHGVGLSQRGAEWMAGKHNKTYTDILAFYYPGMTLLRYAEATPALPTVAPELMETAGPVPTPTPRPTLMPLAQALPAGAWYAAVTEIDDDSSLNLRATPELNGAILMRLYKNQPLIVLENCPQEGWVFVRTDVVEGYVMSKYLTQQPNGM